MAEKKEMPKATQPDNGIIKPLQDRIDNFKKLLELSRASATTYKGNDLLCLYSETDTMRRFPFQFGLAKARRIIENYDLIKAFVDAHDSK